LANLNAIEEEPNFEELGQGLDVDNLDQDIE
jgi:hypothetical protein